MSFRYLAGYVTASYDPLKVPSAPTISSVTVGDTELSVAFTAPANVGGGAITSYIAVAQTSAGVRSVATGTASPITITGLTNNTVYSVQVCAVNAYGPGAFSSPSSATPVFAYIEDVFSTYLYDGTSTTVTVNNGIDLANKGGLVWIKSRNNAVGNRLYDSVRGGQFQLGTQETTAQATNAGTITFNSNGFNTQATVETANNSSTYTYASWTFRRAPKFFDIVTYTGDGTFDKSISHSLASVPGCIIVKATSATSNWLVFTRNSSGSYRGLYLNTTAAEFSSASSTELNLTSTSFNAGKLSFYSSMGNDTGTTYVAYLFAHDAGGFGASGTDNVISCGSVVNTGNPQVTLGYEPQWVLFKSSTSANAWYIVDNMRGLPVGNDQSVLIPNSTAAEVANSNYININATGFTTNSAVLAGQTLIYIAIRRPMKTPTLGTSVYKGTTRTGTGTNISVTGIDFAPDLLFSRNRPNSGYTRSFAVYDKLRGATRFLESNLTTAEQTESSGLISFDQNGYSIGAGGTVNDSAGSPSYVYEAFRRAPGFFDVVCYSGDGVTGRTVKHGLGVVPEFIIVKCRSASTPNWTVYAGDATKFLILETTGAMIPSSGYWNNTAPTSSIFTVGSDINVNSGAHTYVAYLFASCPGVSKIGSYTGNGSSQTINCGFTSGARFVLIKRTDSTGDWYVWDTARGIIAGNDPRLSLNTTVAEVTTDDSVDPDPSGFVVNQVSATNINVNTASYIYLAIA